MLSKFWLKIAGVGGVILGIIMAFLKTFNAGKKSKEAEINEETIENVSKAKEVRNRYQSDDDYAERMRNKYSRKGD